MLYVRGQGKEYIVVNEQKAEEGRLVRSVGLPMKTSVNEREEEWKASLEDSWLK